MKPKNHRHWAEARVNPPLSDLTLAREGAREQKKAPIAPNSDKKKELQQPITTRDVVHTSQKPNTNRTKRCKQKHGTTTQTNHLPLGRHGHLLRRALYRGRRTAGWANQFARPPGGKLVARATGLTRKRWVGAVRSSFAEGDLAGVFFGQVTARAN